MSANFYDNSGKMVGIDCHKYWALPPPPSGTLMPLWPHAVAIAFPSEFSKAYLRTASILAESRKMIAGGFDNGPVWVHAFWPTPPPHPMEGPLYSLILATSTSTAQLTVSSVTGEGNALATCIFGFWGLNVNCFEPMDMPSGHVIVISTVKTSPTLGDYIGAIVGWLVNAGVNYKIGLKLDKLKKLAIAIVKNILRFIQDILKAIFPFFSKIIDFGGSLASFAQQFADWMNQQAERMWRELHGH